MLVSTAVVYVRKRSAPGNAKRSGPSDHLCVESLRPFGSQQSKRRETPV